MKPFVFDPTLEAVEQERQIIGWFRDYPPKNAKALLNRVLQIYHMVPDFAQKSFCNTLLNGNVKDPMAVLAQFIYEMDSVPKLIEQLKREGNHGMVIYRQKFYGISLVTNKKWLSKKDLHQWTPEQETEICEQALDQWMIENRVQHFTEKVVLFQQFGFSGVSRLMNVKMDDESWEEVKKLKMNDQLTKYLNPEPEHED